MKLSGHTIRILVVAALVVLFFIFRDQLPSFDLKKVIEDLSEGLGKWTYGLVALLAFLETGAFVGLVAPGEFTVLLGGAVAGQGIISLPLILAITWISAFLGDTVSFTLGQRLGRDFLVKHGPRVKITKDRLKQVEDYFAKHGGKTIVIGRFLGLVRALAPFIAGTSKMPYRNFAPYSIVGTGLWATTFILIGYFAWQSLDRVAEIISQGLIGFAFFVGFVVAIVVTVRYLKVEENRDKLAEEMEKRRLLRPVLATARRLRPQAVFLYQRITPGGLGLELTTLMAIASVGLFVLIAYWSIVAGDPAPTSFDQTALDFSNDIRSDWLDDVAEVLTVFASGPVMFPLALAFGVVLGVRKHWTELAILVLGLIVTVVSVDLIKDATDRPRPAGGLVETSGSSYPSAHAAYSTFYAWLGVVIAFRLDPGITRRALLITAGIVAAAVLGLTRVYLRVHWMSDVSGGWGLGAAAFGLIGVAALVFVHLRKNLGHAAGDRD